MDRNKPAARDAAKNWWSSHRSNTERNRGFGTCDSCAGRVSVSEGFLCNSVGFQLNPNDPVLVCERCFDRNLMYRPWSGRSSLERCQEVTSEMDVQDRHAARDAAMAWWASPLAEISKRRGYAICDRCNACIPISEGFLCNPAAFADNSPDMVCEQCMTQKRGFTAWKGSARSRGSAREKNWIDRPKCPSCGLLYDIATINPPTTAISFRCLACGSEVPLIKTARKKAWWQLWR